MKICTWNSQGNPLNDAIKLNILNHLLTTEQCNVVMIQECGNFILPAQHSGRYHYVVVELQVLIIVDVILVSLRI